MSHWLLGMICGYVGLIVGIALERWLASRTTVDPTEAYLEGHRTGRLTERRRQLLEQTFQTRWLARVQHWRAN